MKVGYLTLNDHGNFTIDHGKIMEFYFVFSVETLLKLGQLIGEDE